MPRRSTLPAAPTTAPRTSRALTATLRRPTALAGALVVAVATLTTLTVTSAPAGADKPYRWADIDRTKKGYRYTAGLQDSDLTVTRVRGGLRFVDHGTAEHRPMPKSCRRIDVRVGIGAICKVPARYSARRPMRLDIVPRLGHDRVDTSRLSAAFDVHVLADAGNDVVRLGAGDDFVNGYKGVDRVTGGPGNDWIRAGLGDDVVRGGPGRDRLVGVQGDDVLRGGKGDDRVGGGPGRDRHHAGAGRDNVRCGTGRDSAVVTRGDRTAGCESRRVR